MHELGIMTGVVETAADAAREAGAVRVCRVSLSVGVMTEAFEDALRFAFEVLREGTLLEGADLEIAMVQPKSICLDCAEEFSHDRFHMRCPVCGSADTHLLEGRELRIDSIEVDLPD